MLQTGLLGNLSVFKSGTFVAGVKRSDLPGKNCSCFTFIKCVPRRNTSKPIYNFHIKTQVYKSLHEKLDSAVNIG